MPKPDNLERFMLEALEASNFISHVIKKEAYGELSKDVINKFMSKSLKINASGSGIVAIDENGDEIVAEDYGSSISNDGKWLSDKLPDCPFDTDMGGNLRKSSEATALYCCACLALVLQDDSIKKEILESMNQYDFDMMVPSGDNTNTFSNLLESFLDLQSYSVNVIVSAAKYKISERKKDTARFLKDGIPEDLEIGLRSLDISISDINREYSNGKLSPVNVKNLTKVQILSLLEEKNRKIELLIKESDVEVLYRLLNLSTEYVDPVTKRNLNRLAIEEVERIFKANKDSSSIYGDKLALIKSWKSRYYRLARLSVRKECILRYLSDPINFKMPVKV